MVLRIHRQVLLADDLEGFGEAINRIEGVVPKLRRTAAGVGVELMMDARCTVQNARR